MADRSLFSFLRAVLLVVPLFALDLLLFAASLLLLGIPYFMCVDSGSLPLVLRLWRAE